MSENKPELTLENTIRDVLNQKLNDGTVERLVEESIEAAIAKSLANLTSNYGDMTKAIEDKMKSVLLPQIETHDFTKNLVKLDTVLTGILESTVLDYSKMMNNFKQVMSNDLDSFKNMTVSRIFEAYCNYVSKNVDTSELEVEHDDGPHYENVYVSIDVEELPPRFSSNRFKYKEILLTCSQDEKLNRRIEISEFDNYGYRLQTQTDVSIRSLRELDDFDIFILKLSIQGSKIDIDKYSDNTEVEVEAEPEADYN